MPAIVTLPPDADPFHQMATEVHKLLTKPVGTEHARVRQLAKVLRDLANTNYDNGWNAAVAAGDGSVVDVDSEAYLIEQRKLGYMVRSDGIRIVEGDKVRVVSGPFRGAEGIVSLTNGPGNKPSDNGPWVHQATGIPILVRADHIMPIGTPA